MPTWMAPKLPPPARTKAVLGGPAVYESGWSYARVFVWMPLAVWLWCLQSGRRWPAVVLLVAVMWPLLASVQPWLK